MAMFRTYQKESISEVDGVLTEQQIGTYMVSQKIIRKAGTSVDESYGKWIADNFSAEAIDKRLTTVECQTAVGDKRNCITDSEANGRVRESLSWLK